MTKNKLSLMQCLTDEFFRLRPKVRRDSLTKDHLLVKQRYHRVENILRKRYGDLYVMTIMHPDTTIIINKKGKI